MAHGAETAQESSILISHPTMSFQSGKYSYRIERRGDQSIYTVSDGQRKVEVPIAWAVGAGRVSQTYVLQLDGQYYESRVSYFTETNALDITIGHQNASSKTLLEAVGNRMTPEATKNCFECHMTNALENGKLVTDKMLPGVRCIHCHEAAPQHLAGLAEGELHLDEMKKVSKMPPEEVLDFCGHCHRTATDVPTELRDVDTVRFTPYRLSLSKCYDLADARITCIACHDPHQEVGHEKVDYDAKCQACHAGAKKSARSCKIATKDCWTCHMPKVAAPGAHHRFTDHLIQVVKISSRN
jgi:hypothetical protein